MIAVLNFENDIWLHARDGGQEVIEHLLSRHPEFPAARTDFEPAVFVAKITLGEVFGAEEDDIAIVRKSHS